MLFERLTGFVEISPEQVRENMSVDGGTLISHVSGRRWPCGEFETPSLAELRSRALIDGQDSATTAVREVVGNVQLLHTDEMNADSLFQVASQFNTLEMVSPSATPERGVGIYEHDPTQGPACAIAAGAGTIYRNYFATVNGQIGQSVTNQIDCLSDIWAALGNSNDCLWEMRNGYALATESGLSKISNYLRTSSDADRDELRSLLRIGIQWRTQVSLDGSCHKVSQAYCSALPVAYSRHCSSLWADFAMLILEASYEATLCAAMINSRQTGNNTVFLTLLGGGAFGNETDWIIRAIKRSISLYAEYGLDVAIVSYRSSQHCIQQLIADT